MNIILLEKNEAKNQLPLDDYRVRHVLSVLRMAAGDEFDVGIVNGPRGKALITDITPKYMVLQYCWEAPRIAADPISLIVGLSRPQTMRKILQEAAAVGVERIFFPLTALSERSYAHSKLWSTGEFKRHVLAGTAQAFGTDVPAVSFGMSLREAAAECRDHMNRFALDNYEAEVALAAAGFKCSEKTALAIGSERGWTAEERDIFRKEDYVLASMGPRVLRTETAVVAALAVAKSSMGLWK